MFRDFKGKRSLPLRVYPRGWVIFLLTLGAASVICALLRRITPSDVHVPLIFVLAVLIVSLSTEGYFYGFLAAIVGVVGVNYAFTYPYMKLDFSVTGYPLTFLTMLAVGFATSTLTTRLKEQEKLRLESARETMRANLLRAISHDLRTPLTAIRGSISTVLDDDGTLSDDARRELLVSARQDADWLFTMVENLLSITRISGDEPRAIAKQDEILEEVLGEAVQRFHGRGAAVSVSVAVPDEVLILPMDAMLIEQVLLNLMDNAVTHGKNVTHIDIIAAAQGDAVSISVADDGCGVDSALLPHLFDGSLPLSAGHGDGSRFMGIGLSVCKTIVQAHGGSIRAENEASGGAVFTFTLPLGGMQNDDQG